MPGLQAMSVRGWTKTPNLPGAVRTGFALTAPRLVYAWGVVTVGLNVRQAKL
jgi:hypothetical protein